MLVINDRSFATDKKNVETFSGEVGAAYKTLSEGINEIFAAWSDTEDPKGKALKDSMDELRNTLTTAQEGLTEGVNGVLGEIAKISSQVNG